MEILACVSEILWRNK